MTQNSAPISHPTRSLFLVALGHLMVETSSQFMPVLYPVLMGALSLNYTQVGIISLVHGLGTTLVQPFFGYLSDRWDRRAMAVLSVVWLGVLMGLGGNWIQRLFSQQGGTAWGDIFMVNIDRCSDPCQQLRQIVRSGHAWYTDQRGTPVQSSLNLDRVLHHEERHSAQWAAKGYLRMLRDYSWELIRETVAGKTKRLEEDAGLSDGGYA